jgi:hypothetical protein
MFRPCGAVVSYIYLTTSILFTGKNLLFKNWPCVLVGFVVYSLKTVKIYCIITDYIVVKSVHMTSKPLTGFWILLRLQTASITSFLRMFIICLHIHGSNSPLVTAVTPKTTDSFRMPPWHFYSQDITGTKVAYIFLLSSDKPQTV